MQFENTSLSNALSILKSGRSSRNLAGGTTNFLIETGATGVALLASNLVSETCVTVEASKMEPTSISISPEFADIVERCPGAPIDIKTKDSRASISIGKSKFKLPVFAGDSFPKLQVGDFNQQFSVETSTIKKVLNETVAFAPQNDVRHFLNGVQMSFSKDKIICAATNGHAIAVSIASMPASLEQAVVRILPVQAVRQLIRILEAGKSCEIGVADKVIQFKVGNATLRVKPIEGNYPNWRFIIQTAPAYSIKLTHRLMQTALQRVSLFTDRSTPVASFQMTDTGMEINTSNKDGGASTEFVELADTTAPHAKHFHVRTDYLETAVATLSGETLRMSYSEDPASPLWFRKVDSDDCIIVVMPYKP